MNVSHRPSGGIAKRDECVTPAQPAHRVRVAVPAPLRRRVIGGRLREGRDGGRHECRGYNLRF
eukprot:1304-Prorocentrum_minimum.AAC.1